MSSFEQDFLSSRQAPVVAPAGDLIIDPTTSTPHVSYTLHNSTLVIRGTSTRATIRPFYRRIFHHVLGGLKQANKLRVSLIYDEINHDSVFLLMEFFNRLEEESKNGADIALDWFSKDETHPIYFTGREVFTVLELSYPVRMLCLAS
ncbi:SiaC family regulatory phosphoprotein [Marinoscillum furvescens]|uniref:Uncharacterized protein DUF1987 n=1 Tax=Marinoscillum furvescens DSM 4134 TaxID=1122208 RepID=A0A3D9LJG7_MARFU|nr:SiaC family regulatory phosphoprotein [Marinoscillum furvescens]REE05953.1 uncharacterized protein DUF1987 [Marinoscillum furvescens DSM 4134]